MIFKLFIDDRLFPNIINKSCKGIIIKEDVQISNGCILKLIPRDYLFENVFVDVEKVTKKTACEITDEDLSLQCEKTIYNLFTKLNCFQPYIKEDSIVTIIEWNPEKIKIDSSFIIESGPR